MNGASRCCCGGEKPSECCETGCYAPTPKTGPNSQIKLFGTYQSRYVYRFRDVETAYEIAASDSVIGTVFEPDPEDGCIYVMPRRVDKNFGDEPGDACQPSQVRYRDVGGRINLAECDKVASPLSGHRYTYAAYGSFVINNRIAETGGDWDYTFEGIRVYCSVSRTQASVSPDIPSALTVHLRVAPTLGVALETSPPPPFPCPFMGSPWEWIIGDDDAGDGPLEIDYDPDEDAEDTDDIGSDQFSVINVTETWFGSRVVVQVQAALRWIANDDPLPTPTREIDAYVSLTFEIDVDAVPCADAEPEPPCCDAENPPLCRTFGALTVGDDGRVPLLRIDVLALRLNLIINCGGGMGRSGGFGGATWDPNNPGFLRKTFFVPPYNIEEALALDPCLRIWRYNSPHLSPHLVASTGNQWSEATEPKQYDGGPFCPTTGDPFPVGFNPFAHLALGETVYGIVSGRQRFQVTMSAALQGRTGATTPVIRNLTANLSTWWDWVMDGSQTLIDQYAGTQNIVQLDGAGTGGIRNLTRQILPDGLCGSQADLDLSHLPTRGARVFGFHDRSGGGTGSYDTAIDVRALFIGTADCEEAMG